MDTILDKRCSRHEFDMQVMFGVNAVLHQTWQSCLKVTGFSPKSATYPILQRNFNIPKNTVYWNLRDTPLCTTNSTDFQH